MIPPHSIVEIVNLGIIRILDGTILLEAQSWCAKIVGALMASIELWR